MPSVFSRSLPGNRTGHPTIEDSKSAVKVRGHFDIAREIQTQYESNIAINDPTIPNRELVMPQKGPQTDFLSSSADVVLYGGSAGGGKGLATSTPILTSQGFYPMGFIKPGDYVLSWDGHYAMVKYVNIIKPRPSYKVYFHDGSKIICDEDHLWRVFDPDDVSHVIHSYKMGSRIVRGTVTNIKEMYSKLSKDKEYPYYIPSTLPLRLKPYNKPSLFPNAYVMGLFMGLFSSREAPNEWVLYNLNKYGYGLTKTKYSQEWVIRELHPFYSFRNKELLDFSYFTKYYLFAPRVSRMAFIRGYLDVVGKVTEDGLVYIKVKGTGFLPSFAFVLSSFGIVVDTNRIKEGELYWKSPYRVFSENSDNDNILRKCRIGNEFFWRKIIKIERTYPRFTKCITLSRKDGMYLCGHACIPTHNSYGLLLDPLRYINHKDFGAVIFRRTYPEIKNEGGLWDEARRLYLPLGAQPKESNLSFTFPSGSRISFAHLQYEKNIYSWQGSQIPYIGFDEITHFTSRQFWYLLSRQRNVAGIPNLVRGTCNPDPDSFVRQLIDWWIDKDGFPVKERSGVIRWFIRDGDTLIWGDNKTELLKQYPKSLPRSFTFIAAKLSDNQILMQKDPSYYTTLLSLPSVDRKRLLDGNWNVRAASGLYFKRYYFEKVSAKQLPIMLKVSRGWDLAATAQPVTINRVKEASHDPAATAGVKIGKGNDGCYYILDVVYGKFTPFQVEEIVKNCAIHDGNNCVVRLPQDPGQAGKAQIAHFARLLLGHRYRTRSMTGDKVTRAGALSSAAEHGFIKVIDAPWNDLLFDHLEQFPPEVGSPDLVDAAVEAFDELTNASLNVKIQKPVSVRI